MTIKPFIAAVAAVSSSVLFLAHPAHAQAPNFAGYPQNMGPQSQFVAPTPPAMPSMPTGPQMPTMPNMPTAPQQAPAQPAPAPAAAPAAPAATSNTYVKGQCTWHVKNKRPDLPNRLGNGGQWVKNAAARGLSTGKTPRVGAVAEQPGHVAYVEAVNSNGTVKISEMNYNGGVGVVHERTVSASKFTYIY